MSLQYRILYIHNYYLQPGGEDVVFSQEMEILKENNHFVYKYTQDNRDVTKYSQIQMAINTIWNYETYQKVRNIIQENSINIVHLHNTFPLISPSVIDAAYSLHVPIVQTLHNFRFFCANALLYRDQHICEDCFGNIFSFPAITHRCYHDSLPQTCGVVALQQFQKLWGTWKKKTDRFIALSKFSQDKYIDAGLPANKIIVKPNFTYLPKELDNSSGDYVIYIGRLTQEKGIHTLCKAWENLPQIPLKIIGDGPLAPHVSNFCQKHSDSITYLGFQDRRNVFRLLKGARFLIFPSEWYENFPVTIIEAFSCRVPVIGSNLGALSEIIIDGINGLHFEPGNPEDLTNKVKYAWEHPIEIGHMGNQAYQIYEQKYSPEVNYEQLMQIYSELIKTR